MRQVQKFFPSWAERFPIEFSRKQLLILCGIVGVVVLFLIIASSGSSSENTTAQIEALLKANQELQNTIASLKQPRAKNSPSVVRINNPFVETEPGEGFRVVSVDNKEVYIPRGAVFKAHLITSIKTSIQESFVVAETTRTFEMDSRRKIEKGSRLIGTAGLDRALKSVVVKFDTLVDPKGLQHDGLSLLALSDNAFPLIDGLYFSDAGVKYGSALAFGFLSGFASGGMEREATIAGSVAKPSLTNQSLAGLSVASFKVAEEAMNSLKDESVEHVVVPAGTEIYVAFAQKWIVPKKLGGR